jgi:2,3-bisphosphoglycerate-dependent phosphoglycerate mutase
LERATGSVHRDGPGSQWNDRPLSDKGIRAAEELAVTLAAERPIAIYSSPYRRAIQTVEPLADRVGIAIQIVEDLRERLLGSHLSDGWQHHMSRAWENFDYALEGGESSREAQRRVLSVLDDLRSRHRAGTIVAASHGNLIALALNAIVPTVNHNFWRSMRLPDVYRLEWVDSHLARSRPGHPRVNPNRFNVVCLS